MDDHAHEIERLETQIADTDRAAEASAVVRERLAKLKAAEAAAEEARRREREAQAAARALHEAEAAELQERVAPIVEAAAAMDPQFAALEDDVQAYLRRAVADARAFHRRHLALVAQRNALREQAVALGARAAIAYTHALTFV
jgi:hypothetical protein